MVYNYLHGHREKSREIDERLKILYTAAFLEGNPKSIKGLMRKLRLPSGPTRPPLYELRQDTEVGLEQALQEYGLLKS